MSQNKVLSNTAVLLKVYKTLDYYADKAVQWCRNLLWPLAKPTFDRPVFVIGCSRSGTTAVYNVLGMAPELASMHKESHEFWERLHPLPKRNWQSHTLTKADMTNEIREEVSRFFYRHLGARRFLDKANQNCFRIPYLHALFPDAFFVYVKRDGRDNVNSLIHGWGKPDEYGTWSLNLPENVQVDNGKYRRWCFFLFPEWRSFTRSSLEEVCARQWIEANTAVLSARDVVPGHRWVEIVYEDMLTSAVDTFRYIFEKLDLTFTPEIERHCESLSEKPYNAFSTPRLNKWEQENRERIERITPIIRDTMERMGYRG